jgi:hypothetical protein
VWRQRDELQRERRSPGGEELHVGEPQQEQDDGHDLQPAEEGGPQAGSRRRQEARREREHQQDRPQLQVAVEHAAKRRQALPQGGVAVGRADGQPLGDERSQHEPGRLDPSQQGRSSGAAATRLRKVARRVRSIGGQSIVRGRAYDFRRIPKEAARGYLTEAMATPPATPRLLRLAGLLVWLMVGIPTALQGTGRLEAFAVWVGGLIRRPLRGHDEWRAIAGGGRPP